jgi:hypothetical protein
MIIYVSRSLYFSIYFNLATKKNLVEDVEYFLQTNVDIDKKYDPRGRTALIEGKIYILYLLLF